METFVSKSNKYAKINDTHDEYNQEVLSRYINMLWYGLAGLNVCLAKPGVTLKEKAFMWLYYIPYAFYVLSFSVIG